MKYQMNAIEQAKFAKEKRIDELCGRTDNLLREIILEVLEQTDEEVSRQRDEIIALKGEIERLQAHGRRLSKTLGAWHDHLRSCDLTKPQPCTKFCDAKITAWIAKLSEETNEVVQEAENYEMVCKNAAAGTGDVLDAKDRLAEELTDVITVCVSWLDALGYDEEMRGELHRYVNEKNKARGYFGID